MDFLDFDGQDLYFDEDISSKVDELLESVGSNRDKILSATIYIKDMSMFQEMNDVWDNWVNEGFAPARACVEAKMAREELLVEVSIVAAV